MTDDLIDTQKAFYENQMAQRKDQEVKERQWKEVQQNTAMLQPIVDMKDAYAQVVAKNYQPSQQEIEYRRFTSGSYIDNAKGN
jgi:hypothetical protein